MKKLITITLVLFLFCSCDDGEPKVGEIWVYQSDGKTDDPFHNDYSPVSDTLKILSVKRGYVQYVDINTNIVNSCSIRWFKIDSHKIK